MSMWFIPVMIVVALIALFSYLSTLHVAKQTESRATTNDTPIPKAMRDHPTALNPIIWVYIIVGLFFVVMITYYWTQYRY